MNRLWDSDEDNMTPHIHPIKVTVKKPSTKGAKAKSVEKVSVEQLLQELEDTSSSISEQPYGPLFDLYNQEFLQQSVSKGLIIPMHWLSPAMVLLLLLLQENESIMFVIVPLKVSMAVPVTVTFPSLIATSDGIHPVPVFIMDTIYICWLLLIRKATFLFFLY